MRFVILSMVVGLTGCDMNEGPAEETREANEAILEGERPGEVRDELNDIRRDDAVVGGVDNDLDFDRDLRNAEERTERQRQRLADGTRKADANFERSLDEIQRDLKALRTDVDGLGDREPGERDGTKRALKEKLRELSLKIDALDGEVDDRPGKDPVGPG
jgi:hypothetical protein